MTEETAAVNKAKFADSNKGLTLAKRRALCHTSSTGVHYWLGKPDNKLRYICRFCSLEKEVVGSGARGHEVKFYKDGVEVTEQLPIISVDESGAEQLHDGG
jgi:hypothetical protein